LDTFRCFKKILDLLSSSCGRTNYSSRCDVEEWLEYFHSRGLHWFVCEMLNLQRGYVTITRTFFEHRGENAITLYRCVAVENVQQNSVLVRWLIEEGVHLDVHKAMQRAANGMLR
ncbi:hypothetical protein F441_09342, partial [Phytophthora nicotianae CJ01A1]